MPKFKRKPMTIEALKLGVAANVNGKQAKPGDWLVTLQDGTQTVMSDSELSKDFYQVKHKPREKKQVEEEI